MGRLRALAERVAIGGMARINPRFLKAAGGESRPAFHDMDVVYPSLRILDRNFGVIREELEGLLRSQQQIPKYHEVQNRERYISGTVAPDKAWRVFMLLSPLGEVPANEARCPRTTALLKQVPNVFSAFFSILDGGKPIPAHCGEYYGYLRYHLALRVPAERPPSMRVRDQVHTWKEGESIFFDDSCEHEVYNEATDIRVVLIVDVLRPMPTTLHWMNRFATGYLMRHLTEGKKILAAIKAHAGPAS